jgi:hypothetical protein
VLGGADGYLLDGQQLVIFGLVADQPDGGFCSVLVRAVLSH